jgi:hypothetical protein
VFKKVYRLGGIKDVITECKLLGGSYHEIGEDLTQSVAVRFVAPSHILLRLIPHYMKTENYGTHNLILFKCGNIYFPKI